MKTKFRFLSDLHLEFGTNIEIPTPEDPDTILLLAGDIAPWKSHGDILRDFLKEQTEKFRKVIMIPGNHEFYNNGDLYSSSNEMHDELQFEFSNFVFLDDDYVLIDERIIVIGSILFTNMQNQNPVVETGLRFLLNDFKDINLDNHPFSTSDWISIHEFSVSFIKRLLDAYRYTPTLVMTHHAPSFQSINTKRFGSDYAVHSGYASNLNELILNYQPDIWIHGHTHASADYKIGDTRVVCNPRGYEGHSLNPDFDPTVEFEL